MENFNFEYIKLDVCGLVKKMQSKKKVKFNTTREMHQLEQLIDHAPTKKECYKLLSVGGGFSILGVIKYIAEHEGIEELYCSTFRIGKKHFNALIRLHEDGKLKTCHFITSQTQERCDDQMMYKGQRYNYYEFICKTCEDYGWEIKSYDNHSKIYLMKTKKNFYVVETSSNLNENPKCEQFSWENDKSLYEWYLELLKELVKC